MSVQRETGEGGTLADARERLPRLDEIIDLARNWAAPYATGCVYESISEHHPLDCPRSKQNELCFECANEAMALGILALIGEDPAPYSPADRKATP